MTSDTLQAERLIAMADLLAPSTLRAVATLGLADHIAEGVTATADLARRTGVAPDLMVMLLAYLAELGVVRIEDGAPTLTEMGKLLRTDHPLRLRSVLNMNELVGRSDLALVHILHTLRTGEPCHGFLSGKTFWEDVNDDPNLREGLRASADARAAGNLTWDDELVVDGYDWSAVSHVIDVGGHTGDLLIELARRHPHLRGTVVDLKNVAEIAQERFSELGLSDRLHAVVGSFFDLLPRHGDVYLLSKILGDWSDDDAVAILARCGQAAGVRGKVLLAEANVHMPTARGQLWLRASVPTPIRAAADLEQLGRRAGLRVTWRGPETKVRSILEFAQD